MEEPSGPVLATRGVVKRFGDTVAAGGIDVSVGEGTVCGLLGRNGAGKTTLLRMILGLLPPDEGEVRLFGRAAPAGDIGAREAVAGFVEEPTFYPYLAARRNLKPFNRVQQGGERIDPTEDLPQGRRRGQAGTPMDVGQPGGEVEARVGAVDIAVPDAPYELIRLVEPVVVCPVLGHPNSPSLIDSLSDSLSVRRARAMFCRTAVCSIPRHAAISAVLQPS